MLDLACGGGRHAHYFAERGLEVVAVDREPVSIPGVQQFVTADLEDGSPWPLGERRFAAIVVALVMIEQGWSTSASTSSI